MRQIEGQQALGKRAAQGNRLVLGKLDTTAAEIQLWLEERGASLRPSN
jgi:hypothetical protein